MERGEVERRAEDRDQAISSSSEGQSLAHVVVELRESRSTEEESEVGVGRRSANSPSCLRNHANFMTRSTTMRGTYIRRNWGPQLCLSSLNLARNA